LVLGGGEVKLLDMVNAFSVFASNGKRFEPSAVLSVVNSEGEVIFENSPQGQQVISEQTAKKINSILSDNSARAPVFGIDNPLNFKDRKVAAKTGTTQEFRDAWTVGYTPSLAVGVWFGNNDGSFMRYGADGIYVAAPVWRKFMNGELANLPIEEFGEYEKVNSNKPLLTGYVPGKIEYYKIKSGKKISEGKLSKYDSDEVRQVLKTESHSLLFYVNKDFPLTSEKPDFNDPMLWRWEEALGHETENVFLRADPADLNLEENYEKD
jgi:membrane peptidoglycan carboxypeptidase